MIRDSYVLPVDVELLAVQPHAHYRAREIRGVATLPDGTSRLVMHIKDWDFRWQHVYREDRRRFALPKGTRLSMEYTYDNSAGERPQSRSCRRRACSGASARATRWATSGSSCSPTTTPIARA